MPLICQQFLLFLFQDETTGMSLDLKSCLLSRNRAYVTWHYVKHNARKRSAEEMCLGVERCVLTRMEEKATLRVEGEQPFD